MQERLDSIERDFLELEASLGTQEVLGDQARLRDASRRYKQLTPLVACIRELRQVSGDAAAARELMAETSGDERDSFRAEAQAAEQRIEELEERLKLLLLPPDENDGKNVIMEIRGAEGGEEANLFARDLMDMYLAFAARRGWGVETIQVDDSEMVLYNKLSYYFNILNVDIGSPITVFEGYIDSLFFPNSLGLVGVNTDHRLLESSGLDLRYFYDNDEAGYMKAEEKIKAGFPVFLWKMLFEDIVAKKKPADPGAMLHRISKIKDMNKLSQLVNEPYSKLSLESFFSRDEFDLKWIPKRKKRRPAMSISTAWSGRFGPLSQRSQGVM